MKKLLLISFLFIVSMLLIAPASQAQRPNGTCVEVNGLMWCYNNQECGQPCNEVCQSIGLGIIESNDEWFEAQNTPQECQAISDAFGINEPVSMNNFGFACIEDFFAAPHGPGLNGPLLCSTFSACPENLRTSMDQLGVPCEGPGEARRAICPCELEERNVPTLSEWGLIAMAGLLGIAGLIVIRRRLATA